MVASILAVTDWKISTH